VTNIKAWVGHDWIQAPVILEYFTVALSVGPSLQKKEKKEKGEERRRRKKKRKEGERRREKRRGL